MTEPDDAVLASLKAQMDRIEVQTTRHNGRMTRMEYLIEGNPDVRLPSGERDRGIAGKVHDQGEVVDEVKTAIRVGKRLLIAVGAAALGLFGNLAAGFLT